MISLHFVLIVCPDFQDSKTESLSREAANIDKSSEDKDSKCNLVEERADNPEDILPDQVPTLALHEMSPIQTSSVGLSSKDETSTSTELHEPSHSLAQEKVLINGELGSPDSKRKNIVARKVEVKGSSSHVEHGSSSSAPKSQDYSPRKVKFHYYCCLLCKTFEVNYIGKISFFTCKTLT